MGTGPNEQVMVPLPSTVSAPSTAMAPSLVNASIGNNATHFHSAGAVHGNGAVSCKRCLKVTAQRHHLQVSNIGLSPVVFISLGLFDG